MLARAPSRSYKELSGCPQEPSGWAGSQPGNQGPPWGVLWWEEQDTTAGAVVSQRQTSLPSSLGPHPAIQTRPPLTQLFTEQTARFTG